MSELFFEMRLVDGDGRTHAAIRRPISEHAAYMGPRVVPEMRLGVIPARDPNNPFSPAMEIIQVKELRRKLLTDCARMGGAQMADFLEDREGWHGIDRQESAERAIK